MSAGGIALVPGQVSGDTARRPRDVAVTNRPARSGEGRLAMRETKVIQLHEYREKKGHRERGGNAGTASADYRTAETPLDPELLREYLDRNIRIGD